MSDSESLITIDLTDSLCLVNHNALTNLIIEIEDTDESFTGVEGLHSTPLRNLKDLNKPGLKKSIKKRNEKKILTTPDAKIGQCSICCERLGKRQSSSTICGHIFCTSCIELALHHDKRCPQCRKVLKGATKYHPIYIPLIIE